MADKPTSVEVYIAGFTGPQHASLVELRHALRAAIPDAHEKLSNGMPTISIRKNILYYAAWEKHIAVYGWLGADAAVLAPLKSHVSSKGTLKFPIDADLPMADIVNLALHIAERCR
jgi:uncharacterized protein YdhG (YjbR/CyaY superfamily)